MTDDARPQPTATLAYESGPKVEDYPYGRGDRALLVACFAAAAGNVLFAVIVSSPLAEPYELHAVRAVAAWFFSAAYVAAWLVGQTLFWTRRRERLPPFSTFALLCISPLAMVGPVFNLVFLGGL